ncbi:hypothetical protein DRP53_07475 [candidate division WOR-3 bacterium]|uniref:Amine oxidase domain-containing protein n=1 Tax=candidate division WOR-3 bacterium TaxID=2052148 RepID=A0A660SFT7_UNCW3|nr:MAG: hypothetical protein DRP53_07475 [candidate division WOR-3 bacterium]
MILILGAGPTGLSAAMELTQCRSKTIVIEKENQVGGLSKTLTFGRFKSDIGPHRFFSQNPSLYKLIGGLLGKRWRKVDRLTRFYIDGEYYYYPIRIGEALIKVGPYRAIKILADYLSERLRHREIRTFKDFIISNFGTTLARFNMLNYTEKIWGLPCELISPDWARQRIRGLSLKEAVLKTIRRRGGPKSLVDQFYYPDEGSGLIYDSMAERIGEGSGKIILNAHPVKIDHDGHRVIEVVVRSKEGDQIFRPDHLISTIPITELVYLLDPPPPREIEEEAAQLRFRSHVSLFLTLDRKSIFEDQWIYFPDPEIPFGRIMEPKNFSSQLAPSDKTSLLIEYFTWYNDEIWKMRPEELSDITLDWLGRLGFVKKTDVINCYIHREKYAYPVYDLDYKDHLDRVKDYLSDLNNLILAGRAGSFRYNNQDHALEMGILAAKSIIEGRRYNIDRVGSEPEYLERGYLT